MTAERKVIICTLQLPSQCIVVFGIEIIAVCIEDHQGRIVMSLSLIEKWRSLDEHNRF